MKLQFDPDDETAFHQARDDLVERFERTPAGRDLGWVASGVMDFKWAYLDGDLVHWSSDDIAEILLGLYPAKAMLEAEDLDLIPTGFAAFLRFLAHTGTLSSADARFGAELVEQLRPHFHQAALDDSNWSMGKRLMVAARVDGVDLADPDLLQRFMEDFNQRPPEERDAILGSSNLPMPGPDPTSGLIDPLPPITLPPQTELEEAARATIWPERVRRLVEFVGDGRPITNTGKLKLADGEALIEILETNDQFNPVSGGRMWKTSSTANLPGVHLTFLIALESNTLVQRGTKVVPGPNADVLDDVLESFYGLWLTLFTRIGPTQEHFRDDAYGFGWYAEELDELVMMLLLELYRHGEMTIEEATAGVWRHLRSVFDLDSLDERRLEMEADTVERALRRVFDRLEEFGTLEVHGVAESPSPYGGTPDRSGGTVSLTPLGMWVVQRFASRVTSAPVVGELKDASAEELLSAASDLPEAEAAAEIDAWIDYHGPGAATLLVEAFRSAGETGRGLVFKALLRIGPDAADAVATFGGDPEVDQFLTIWRVFTLDASPGTMDCGDDRDRFVRLVGSVIELWGPEVAVSAWAGPAASTVGLPTMLETVWRVERPETEGVLAAIGTTHPDKQVSKAARKALFKFRSIS